MPNRYKASPLIPQLSIRQPAYIRAINHAGELLAAAGVLRPHLATEALLHRAVKKTGLKDFGHDSFLAGLEVLINGLNEEAQLSQIGRVVACHSLLDHLCVRLQLINARQQRPEIELQQICKPLFIVGLPRTGTTILYELLAQDPAFRSPATWEVARPIPPPKRETYRSDRRIRTVDRVLPLAEKLSPGFRAIHAIGAQLPQECVYLLAPNFASEQFSYMYNIPSYRAWTLEHDMTAAYRWHAHYLQHLQVDYEAQRWVLKTPAHLSHLDSLLAQYPDAAVVWTHRRPLDAITSFSSLVTTLHRGFSDVIDASATGAQEFAHFATSIARGVGHRDTADNGQFFDASFSDICADPIAVIRKIYRHFGMHFDESVESRMRDYLARRPRYLFGEHTYRRQDFGLDAAQESQLYGNYMSRFVDYLR